MQVAWFLFPALLSVSINSADSRVLLASYTVKFVILGLLFTNYWFTIRERWITTKTRAVVEVKLLESKTMRCDCCFCFCQF